MELQKQCVSLDLAKKMKDMKKEIKLKINRETDRENMVVALANAGYQVRVEEDYKLVRGTDYYVCFLAP